MKTDTVKLIFAYVAALGIIAFTCYALVLHPFVVESDTKLFLTGAAGGAFTFLWGDQVAARSQRQTESAIAVGLNATPSEGPAQPQPTPEV
jgi:hypothetical protein